MPSLIAPFAWFDNTCAFCREGLTTSCLHGGFFSETQAEAVRVPRDNGIVGVAGDTIEVAV